MIDDIFISLDDLKRVYQKKRRKIVRAAIAGALLCFVYFLSKPSSYEAVATFQQAAPRGDQGFDLKSFMRNFSGGASEGSTAPVMLSHSVLGKVVEELGLQAVVEESPFVFQHVRYAGEKSFNLLLRFTESDVVEILNSKEEKLATGSLGKKIELSDLSFTIIQAPQFKMDQLYRLTMLPKRSVIADVKSRVSIKPLRDEKNILAIKFSDPNRHLAAAFVNTLMAKYEEFLIEENKTIIGSQLSYLDRRQNELNDKLDIDLNQHVALLKKSLQEKGFMGVQEELQSILEPLKTHHERLDAIHIEMASLEKRIPQAEPKSVKLVHQFGHHLAEQMQEASHLLQKLQKEEPLPSSPTFAALISDLEQAKELWQNSNDKTVYLEKKEALKAHLNVFLHHLAARQKSLQESSSYVDGLEIDFHGMTLGASRGLFQNYSNQLDELHAELKQVIFFRDHLHEPHFEISTLSNVLKDTVTQQLVEKSSEVEAQLCDSINRSTKEHERLKETLATQKRFLESHLSQTIELGKIRIQLIQEKIGSLYIVMKDLLGKEKEVLENKIADLKQNLQEIPELWHLEKRLDFKAGLTKGMMEGLTQITESKNLSRHLYQIESKPLDTALEPLAPAASHLLLKTIGGGVGVASFCYLFFLFQAFFRGLPLSLTTLRLMGARTSGSLSHQATFDDLETLRSIASFLMEKKLENGTRVALLSERGSDFCFNLASLLSLQQQKIVIIDCNFDRIVDPQDQPGLWHYLNGDDTPFRKTEKCDYMPAGGTTLHGVELLSTDRFADLLIKCRKQYDFIFLLRQSKLSSQDALQALQIADLAVITTYEESQETLKPYLKEKICTTFAQYSIVVE